MLLLCMARTLPGTTSLHPDRHGQSCCCVGCLVGAFFMLCFRSGGPTPAEKGRRASAKTEEPAGSVGLVHLQVVQTSRTRWFLQSLQVHASLFLLASNHHWLSKLIFFSAGFRLKKSFCFFFFLFPSFSFFFWLFPSFFRFSCFFPLFSLVCGHFFWRRSRVFFFVPVY